MFRLIPIVAILLSLPVRPAVAETLLFCPFDSLEGWTIRSVGSTKTSLTIRSEDDRCVAMSARRGTVFLSRDLPLEAVRGERISVSCQVESVDVVRGPQLSSTAKIHLAVKTPEKVSHHAARLLDSSDWHDEGFSADVPENASRVVLNLGLDACEGQIRFDRLIVRSERPGFLPLSLARSVNASHEQLSLGAFPKGTVEWEGIPFEILDLAEHRSGDCFRLKGIDHPDWPEETASPIPVGTRATSIYILHAVLGSGKKSPSPCAMWTARFVGGSEAGLSLFEGREIGAVSQTEDLENWKVAWQGKGNDGKPITFGVTQWVLYHNVPVKSISCRAYHGSSPIVLAVTAAEEPPEPELDEPYDESGGASDDEFQ